MLDATAPRYYLFSADEEPQADRRPGVQQSRTCSHAPTRSSKKCVDPSDEAPKGCSIGRPAGHDRRLRTALRRTGKVIEDAEPGWFALQGQPGALGHRHHQPEAGTRRNQPAERHLRLHRQRPAKPSRTSPAGSPSAARRGRSGRSPPKPPNSSRATSRSSSTTKSRPGRSSTSSRTRTGSTAAPAPRSPAASPHPGGPGPRDLPADRRPADQPEADQPDAGLGDARRAGARPGPQGGPDRPAAGRPLPAPLLPLPRRSIATIGLGVYAVFFFALIKLIPITLTLPGIAGLILTIGVAADSNIVIFERIKEEVRAGRSVDARAITRGYRRGIATIIDANVDHPADRVHPLRARDRRGQGLRLHARRRHDRLAVHRGRLHPGASSACFGRGRPALARRLLGAGEQRRPLALRLHRRQPLVLLDLGDDPASSARSRSRPSSSTSASTSSPARRIKVAPRSSRPTVEDVRAALDDAGARASAEIQQVTEPDSSAPTSSRSRRSELLPERGRRRSQTTLDSDFGIKPERLRQHQRRPDLRPAGGAQRRCIAIIFSLLRDLRPTSRFRFEPKFAVPVLIALFHDILITAGVYSLTGREVTSGTVAAFLTILGYSLYDTIIVFDRIRENVPRMPRAAFSQIVNRSMSEVLTRSLIDRPLDPVFLVGVAADLRRRHPAGLRLRDDGRDLLRYLLVDLHRLAGADRLEGTRAGLRAAARADRRARRARCRRSPTTSSWRSWRPTTDRRREPSARRGARPRPSLARRRSRPPSAPATATAATRRRNGEPGGRPRRGRAARAQRSAGANAASSGANTGGIARWPCSSGSRWGSPSGTSRCSCPIASGRASSAPSSARSIGAVVFGAIVADRDRQRPRRHRPRHGADRDSGRGDRPRGRLGDRRPRRAAGPA